MVMTDDVLCTVILRNPVPRRRYTVANGDTTSEKTCARLLMELRVKPALMTSSSGKTVSHEALISDMRDPSRTWLQVRVVYRMG